MRANISSNISGCRHHWPFHFQLTIYTVNLLLHLAAIYLVRFSSEGIIPVTVRTHISRKFIGQTFPIKNRGLLSNLGELVCLFAILMLSEQSLACRLSSERRLPPLYSFVLSCFLIHSLVSRSRSHTSYAHSCNPIASKSGSDDSLNSRLSLPNSREIS